MSSNAPEKRHQRWQFQSCQSLAKQQQETKHSYVLQVDQPYWVVKKTKTEHRNNDKQTQTIERLAPKEHEAPNKITSQNSEPTPSNAQYIKLGMYISQLLAYIPFSPRYKQKAFDLSIQCHLATNQEMIALLPCLQSFFIEAFSDSPSQAHHSSLTKIPQLTPDKQTLSLLLYQLLEETPLPASMLREVSTIQDKLKENDSDITALINEVILVINNFYTHSQIEKKEYEQLLSELREQLTEFNQYISLNQEQGKQAREERLSIAKEIESHLLTIKSDKVQQGDQNIPDGKKQNLEDLIHLFDSYRSVNKRQYLTTQQNYHLLNQKVKLIEQENIGLKRLVVRARNQALRDNLTGIWNRQALDEAMQKEYHRWQRYRKPLSMIMWDIDFFKKVNDQYGHAAGDKILRIIANIFNSSTRNADFIARFGGEEFIGLFPETPIEYALGLAEKIRLQISQYPFDYNQHAFSMTTSAGLTCFKTGDKIEDVFRRADSALYQAKEQGRNCCVTQ